MVFHLSSRQSEGLLRSLFALMKLDNDVPDHTTISRRKAKLGKVPFYQDKQKTPLHILIDSSGLAVHAGQLRRAPKSRDYRKLHLCVDEQTGEVVACELTSKRARDSSRVASLVGQIDSPISSARADTAYDAGGVYEAIENHSAHRSPRVLIPPRKGALQAVVNLIGNTKTRTGLKVKAMLDKNSYETGQKVTRPELRLIPKLRRYTHQGNLGPFLGGGVGSIAQLMHRSASSSQLAAPGSLSRGSPSLTRQQGKSNSSGSSAPNQRTPFAAPSIVQAVTH